MCLVLIWKVIVCFVASREGDFIIYISVFNIIGMKHFKLRRLGGSTGSDKCTWFTRRQSQLREDCEP